TVDCGPKHPHSIMFNIGDLPVKRPANANSNTSFASRLTNYGGMSLAIAAAMSAKPAKAGVITSGTLNVATNSTGGVWFWFLPSTPTSTTKNAYSFGLSRVSFFFPRGSSRTARFGGTANAQVLLGLSNYAAQLGAGVFVGPSGIFGANATIARTSVYSPSTTF